MARGLGMRAGGGARGVAGAGVAALAIALAAALASLGPARGRSLGAGGAGGQVGRRAFYILFAGDVAAPDFAEKYAEKYAGGTFIANPNNFTTETTQAVRDAVPGSRVLLYFDFQHLPFKRGCGTGHPMGDRTSPPRDCKVYPCGLGAFGAAFQEVVKPEWLVTRVKDGEPVCGYPGLTSIVWTEDSAAALAGFVGGWAVENGFDGVYLDGREAPNRFASLYKAQINPKGEKHLFDTDGDGKADSPDQTLGQYVAWAPFFTVALRETLGPEAVILSNSAGPLSDPMLNGITVEAESCRDSKVCYSALRAQRDVSFDPSKSESVLWLTHSELVPPEKQCALVADIQQQMPWVLAGTDFFDGSHVVCD